jgi:hypothetical protein
MPVIARSLVNYPQTISGQTIPPNGQRTYAGPTSALTTASNSGLVQLQTVADSSSAQGPAQDAVVGTMYLNVPLAGDTYVAPDDAEVVVHKPAGTIATLTHTMPLNPYDGQTHRVAFTQIVTTLTMNATGQTLNSGLTAGAVGSFGAWRYRLADTTWYRVG